MNRTRSSIALALVALCGGCPALVRDDYVVNDSPLVDAGTGEDVAAADAGGYDAGDNDANDAGEDASAEDAPANDAISDTQAEDVSNPSCATGCGVGRSCVSGACTPQWVATSAPPSGFAGRQRAASCAMGSRVFIWGGANDTTPLADGALYDPTTDTWATVAAGANSPSARVGASCVWTGSVIVVFGGGDFASTSDLNTGALYNPATSTWSAMTTGGAPAARRYARMFWTGSRVLVIGGEDHAGQGIQDALLYDPLADKWQPKAGNPPAAALDQSIALLGADALVFGGNVAGSDVQTLSLLSTGSNAWATPTSTGVAPSARSGAFGAVDGTTFVVWGGTAGADGARYTTTNGWGTALAAPGQPSSRKVRGAESGWSARIGPGQILFLGGVGDTATTFEKDGAVYDLARDAWTAVPAWPSGADHAWAAGVYTDAGEFVVWGGLNGATVTAAGERWRR